MQYMKPVIINADYLFASDQIPDLKESCEIHFTRFGKNPRPGGNVVFYSDAKHKIFVNVNEPSTSAWVEQADHVIANQHHYTKIVTSNPKILENCSNAVFLAYGTTWLNKSKHHPDSLGTFTEELGNIPKENSVSMLCGALSGKLGYSVRHTIWNHRKNIPAKLNFYSSTRFPIPGEQLLPDDDKIHLFKSMYSVVVESSSEPNYFSEKLIDCLITKTIPIYWGCPNISDFFDTSYWINPQRILTTEYTETYYKENLEKINYNFEKAKQHCVNFVDRIIKAAGEIKYAN